MKKTIRINYMDFGKYCNPETEYFTRFLRQKYNVLISDNPDYIFYTLGGNTHHSFPGIRIFWTGENVVPNFNYCDYALGFHYLNFEDRYFRLPLWRTCIGELPRAIQKGAFHSDTALLNRSFCATVISNNKQTDGKREEAFLKLSMYKPVASGGRWFNTTGGPVDDKIAFQRHYKFALAFENTYASGYTTEKIIQAFASDCVPIYYGNPRICEEFNPDAFVNAHDFESIDHLVSYVKKIDQDQSAYLRMMRAPLFKGGELPPLLEERQLMKFLSQIFDPPLSQAKRTFYAKPYQDIDCNNIKMRDVKSVITGYSLKRIQKFCPFLFKTSHIESR